MFKFYTVQLSLVRGLKKNGYEDLVVFDITAGSGIKEFAPSWDLVRGVKEGSITWEEYQAAYLDQLRHSYINNRSLWEEMIANDIFAIGCYCRPITHCHRFILADVLQKLGGEYLGELGNKK